MGDKEETQRVPLKLSGRCSPPVFKPEFAGLFSLATVDCPVAFCCLGESKSDIEGGSRLFHGTVKMTVVTSKLFSIVYCT